MKQIIFQALIVGFIVFAFIVLIGCSTSIIVKECEPSTSSDKQICKTLKPWE
jgi:hypothetical protein